VITRKKWLFSDLTFVVAIAFLGSFNYTFDRLFREMVITMPQLAFPYMFQYQLVLPIIDAALLLIVFNGLKLSNKRKRKDVIHLAAKVVESSS